MSSMPKKRADKNLEADVKKDVQEVLERHGWWWWMPPSSQYSKTGISDFHAIKNRLFMAIETKRGVGVPKPTANQVAFLQKVKEGGHFAFVVNDTRVKHLDAFLGSFEIATKAAQKSEKVPDEHGAQMINCMRELQQEI
jgi:hypothetical protein